MMKVVRGFLLVSVVVLAAGCASSGQKDVSVAECALARHSETFKEKCNAPILGWKGANASDFTFSH